MACKEFLLHWSRDQGSICAKIRDHRAQLKVIMKVKDDSILLPLWLEHYLSFLRPGEIVIADNESSDPSVLDIYRGLPDDLVVFAYSAEPAGGFHNNIHNRELFSDLYVSFRDSCEHVLFVDCDEFLITSNQMEWTSRRDALLAILTKHRGMAVPTAWLDTVPGSRNTVYVGSDGQQVSRWLAWGKPVIPSSFEAPGFLIHNIQFPAEIYERFPQEVLILLHLKNYSTVQRLAVNRLKLIARGLVTHCQSMEEISRLDPSESKRMGAERLVDEITSLLNQSKDSLPEEFPMDCLRFSEGGKVDFSSDQAKEVFTAMLIDFEASFEKSFSLLHGA